MVCVLVWELKGWRGGLDNILILDQNFKIRVKIDSISCIWFFSFLHWVNQCIKLENQMQLILMDYPIYINTISMVLPIFKGVIGQKLIKWFTSVPEDCFYLSKQIRPWWNATLCGISSGSSLFAKVPVYWHPEWKVKSSPLVLLFRIQKISGILYRFVSW